MRTAMADLARKLRKEFKEPQIGITYDNLGQEVIQASFKDDVTRQLAIVCAIQYYQEWHKTQKRPWNGDIKNNVKTWEARQKYGK